MAIAQVRPRGLISSGDIPAHEVPPEFWTLADNVSFRDVYAERVDGWRRLYDANATIDSPLFLLNSFFRSTNYWMYGCPDAVGVTDAAGVHSDITPVTAGDVVAPSGRESQQWTGCELNGRPVMNYQQGSPVEWDRVTANAMTGVAGWNSGETCQAIRSFKFYLLALNIGGVNDWPSVVRWSDSAGPGSLPTTWVPGAGNDAGSLSFGDTGEGIVDGHGVRDDRFLVFKSHSTYAMNYVGGELIFGQEQFLTDSGCLATNCVASFAGNLVVLTDGDVIITDGRQARSIVDKQTRRTLFSNLDQTNYERSFVAHNKNRNEVWICYPENGADYPTRALVWDTNSGDIQERDVINVNGALSNRDTLLGGSGTPHLAHGNVTTSPAPDRWVDQTGSWAARAGAWNQNAVQAANDGLVGINIDDDELAFVDVGDDYAEGNLQVRLRRESLDFGDQRQVKLITELWPRIVGKVGQVINIRVGSQMEPDQLIEWSQIVPFTIGTDQKVDTFASGRFLSFEFSSTDGTPWTVTGFDVNLEQGGRY